MNQANQKWRECMFKNMLDCPYRVSLLPWLFGIRHCEYCDRVRVTFIDGKFLGYSKKGNYKIVYYDGSILCFIPQNLAWDRDDPEAKDAN